MVEVLKSPFDTDDFSADEQTLLTLAQHIIDSGLGRDVNTGNFTNIAPIADQLGLGGRDLQAIVTNALDLYYYYNFPSDE